MNKMPAHCFNPQLAGDHTINCTYKQQRACELCLPIGNQEHFKYRFNLQFPTSEFHGFFSFNNDIIFLNSIFGFLEPLWVSLRYIFKRFLEQNKN